MPVKAIRQDYQFEPRDLQKNYGDNLLLYVGWDHHTLFCAAHALLVSPQQTLQDLIDQQITATFYQHPEFEKIDWSTVQLILNRQPLAADFSKTLAELGFDHKSLLRFITPDLNGYQGRHV
ncbi:MULTISPECIES: phenol hydroxylase subunit P4 [unclassified Acinetobacter]|uniref:phenol hydroxylase subunit P4 n=1 Tax=unclassified Acinetobacter TaxID=196816 RepID=UPI0029341F39|nr:MULTISPECIES: phenol hydroxylase subunit P4 [unclassified Acinetobacter]WOE30761.1 phenol hydroxylase subunit P4 [Acinetobacter sp. SAAs470]WOE38954.1 phenol hydroxylase subunit P4 [Acinetobacter sp. SAAs474]